MVGILIGTVINGKVSAMKTFSFAGTNATPLAVPDPIPSSSSFCRNCESRRARSGQHRHHPGDRSAEEAPLAGQDDQDDPSQDFFFHFFDGRPDGQPQAERSLGSGVIIDKRGYILTNNHVVDQATKIQVQLSGDTTKYTAKVVGVDDATDLAVIKD